MCSTPCRRAFSRKLNLIADAFVAIDGSKFKAVNSRNRNFTKAKLKRRLLQVDESVERYLGQIASADRQESTVADDKTKRLKDRIALLEKEIDRLKKFDVQLLAEPDQQSTSDKYRRVARWEHEAVVEVVEARLEKEPDRMRARRETVEHPFGTLKYWMGYTHFQTKTLKRVSTEMSLHILAYNMKRVMNLLGVGTLIEAMRA